MITLSHLTALLLGELLVALLVISGLLGFFALRRKGLTRGAARHLAERVQADKPQRVERLKHLLTERYGYTGGDLERAVHDITQAEMRLYQNIVNGFIKDDQVTLQQVDVDVENLVLAYQALNVPNAPGKPAQPVGSADDGEMQRLKEENERLSDELRVTMDTMGRMLNEYSSMFAGGSGDNYEKARVQAADAESPDGEAVLNDDAASAVDDRDFAIPDYTSDEVMDDSAPVGEWSGDAPDVDGSDVIDEVSGIIDEVMGIADDMNQETTPEPVEDKPPPASESLLDDLEQVDIEIPEEVEVGAAGGQEAEAESLEEEWAKLLEEEAASKKAPKPD